MKLAKKTFIRGDRTISLLVGLLVMTTIGIASAAHPGSLYTYNFANSTGVIDNSATANTTVDMTLVGDWSATTTGVIFTGNTTTLQSVGHAKRSSGNTIDIATNRAVGSATVFKYDAPSGSACFSDSPNITQIGFFAANTTQMKLQLSNCGKNKTKVFPECRMAGNNTSSSVLPVTGTTSLIDGEIYAVQCVKGPDGSGGSGKATVTLTTVHIDPINGNQTTINNFNVTNTGLMRSTAHLSVAGKYPLVAQNKNTDQFNGEALVVSYCSGTTAAIVQDCLNTEIAI